MFLHLFYLLLLFFLSLPARKFLISIYSSCISLFLFLSSFFLLLYLFSFFLLFPLFPSVMWRDSIGLYSFSLDTQPFNFYTKTRNSALKTKHKYGSTQHGSITDCTITIPFVWRSDISEKCYPRSQFYTFQAYKCANILKRKTKKTHIVFQRLLILSVIYVKSHVSPVLWSLRLLLFLLPWPHFTRC